MKRELIRLVVSDFHLGTGNPRGQFNPLEDFHEGERFVELLEHYTSGQYARHEVELILNGDIFDLLKVPLEGTYPDKVTEEMAARKLELALDGHPLFCDAIVRFLEHPGTRLVYLPGNHDIELLLPQVQEELLERCAPGDLAEKVTFITRSDTYYLPEGIQIRHGHQLESMNSFDYRNILLHRPGGPPVIDFPWGSLFSLKVIQPFKTERFHLDQVRPFKRYILYGLFFDTWFTVRILSKFVYYFFQTRFFETWRRQANFWATLRMLREEFGWVSHFDELVETLMRRSRGVDIIITGHSHQPRIKQLPDGRLYLNSGTWTHMISLDIHRIGQRPGLTYVTIEYDDDGRPQANLMRWRGKPREKQAIRYQP
jgi:UDP-2,3-diacylglucosamine pyrophosphatase LpxH